MGKKTLKINIYKYERNDFMKKKIMKLTMSQEEYSDICKASQFFGMFATDFINKTVTATIENMSSKEINNSQMTVSDYKNNEEE